MNEVTDSDAQDTDDSDDIAKFDPGLTQRMIGVIRPVLKTYFRSEVRDWVAPAGGALVVGQPLLPGGMFPMDVPIFSVDFYDKFGYDRPVYTLSHDILFMVVPGGPFLPAYRLHPGQPRERGPICAPGGVVVISGGDYDAYRPTFFGERYRLQRAQGLRPHRDRSRRTHRARGVHRRPRNPALLVPRHLAGASDWG